MFIRKLKPGDRAAKTADRICINRWDGGQITWAGSVKVGEKVVEGASPASFATIQEAETDAIAWARGHGATDLQIEGPNV